MKIKFSKKFISFIILSFLFNPFILSAAQSSTGLDVNLHVGTCNFNNICEPHLGEDLFVCALDCTPVVVPPNSSNGASGSLVMDNSFNNLTVQVSYNSAIIRWTSFLPTISNIKWGTNFDYKDGVIKNINYLVNHEMIIQNLSEGTTYYFNIESENLLRKTATLDNQSFKTLSLLDTIPPGSPINLNATSDPSGITLSWNNPKDIDFDYVRVMRTTDRYYGSPFSGVLVYEGRGIYFLDSNVKEGKKYFYSLFSRDQIGNYSSGSLVSLIHNPRRLDSLTEMLPPLVNNTEPIEPLNPFSFFVNQSSSNYDFKIGSHLNLDGNSSVTIKTDYFYNIKNNDLWVSVKNRGGKIIGQYSFSRVRDQDGYIKTILPSFKENDIYYVSIYKYSMNEPVLVNKGVFNINNIDEKKTSFSYWYIFWLIIPIIITFSFLWLLYIIYRKIKNSINHYREKNKIDKVI